MLQSLPFCCLAPALCTPQRHGFYPLRRAFLYLLQTVPISNAKPQNGCTSFRKIRIHQNCRYLALPIFSFTNTKAVFAPPGIAMPIFKN